MIDLNLFSKLLKDTQATMILTQKTDTKLEYHLIGRTLAYTIATTGVCDGSLDKEQVVLNIDLKLLNILLKRGFSFDLFVHDGKAVFKTTNEMNLKPLCIEKNDPEVLSVASNIAQFVSLYSNEDKKELIPYDLQKVKILASLSSKNKEIIQITSDFSVVELNSTFIILKEQGNPLAINGNILNTLLSEGGEFYKFGTKLYFISNSNNTFVIFNMVLPSPAIDLSILKKGALLEHYKIDTKEITDLIYNLSGNLNNVVLDFANSVLTMSNDNGEILTNQFSITSANTVSMQEYKKSPKKSIKIEMSSISLSKQVCKLIPFFKGEIDVFIFKNKIIFRKNKLYIVFGR